MTVEKFELMALDRGVTGKDNGSSGRIVEPAMVAVAVSPQGFVFLRDEFGDVSVSDVGRLAASPGPWTDVWNDPWSTYKYRTEEGDIEGPGYGGIPRAQARVGNEITPMLVDPGQFQFGSLAQFGRMIASPLEESGNDPYGDYTPTAAAFVNKHFGVDPSHIDWQAANKARLVNSSPSPSLASLDSESMCTALRLAVAQQAAPAAINQAFSRHLTGRARPQPPTRPTR